MTAIIGPNGSGKTTFFNVLSGILPATKGRIFFRDEDVTSRKAHAMTGRGMARTFQNIRLFQNLTAHDNVVVGRYSRTASGLLDGVLRSSRLAREERENRAKADALLHFVGLDAHAGTMAKHLPYGAQRRLEIARALASDPVLLMLDEPAAGMNPKEVDDLLGLDPATQGQGPHDPGDRASDAAGDGDRGTGDRVRFGDQDRRGIPTRGPGRPQGHRSLHRNRGTPSCSP